MDDEAAEEDPREENEGVDSVLKPSTKPKTEKQRKREATQIDEQKAAQERKAQRRLETDVAHAKDIANVVKKVERKREKLAKERRVLKAKMAVMPKKRIGKNAVPVESPVVTLTEELADSLRRVKPEGSLLLDRYQSLTSRNLIEPRVQVKKKKLKTKKTYQKLGYKMFK